MKKYINLILFLVIPHLVQAVAAGRPSAAGPTQILAPLQHKDRIVCPPQAGFDVYNPEYLPETKKLRFWYGGKFRQWRPMFIDIDDIGQEGSKAEAKSAPTLAVKLVELRQIAERGVFVMSCTYQAQGVHSSAEPAKTTLTIRANECKLDAALAFVSCR